MKTLGLVPLLLLVFCTLAEAQQRFFNVITDFGAVGDCVTDDTASFQSFFSGLTSKPNTLIVPRPPGGCYKLTATINIPFSSGWSVEGAGSGAGGATGVPTSLITMFTNNVPMFRFTGVDTHSFHFEHLALTYSTAQPNSNTNAIFFSLDTNCQGGIMFTYFNDIDIGNGYRGWQNGACSTTAEPWWRSSWSYIWVEPSMSGATIYLVPSPPEGIEGGTFENIENLQAISEPQMTIAFCENCIVRNVSSLSGRNEVLSLAENNNLTVEQLHLEAHTFAASSAAIDFSNSWGIIDGLTYIGVANASTTDYLVQSIAGGGQVSVRSIYGNATSMGPGSSIALLHSSSTGATHWSLYNYVLLGGIVNYSSSDPILTSGQLDYDNGSQWFNPVGTASASANYCSAVQTFNESVWNGWGPVINNVTAQLCPSSSGLYTPTYLTFTFNEGASGVNYAFGENPFGTVALTSSFTNDIFGFRINSTAVGGIDWRLEQGRTAPGYFGLSNCTSGCTSFLGLDPAGNLYLPTLARSTAVDTGALCWNRTAGLVTYNNSSTCLTSSIRFKHNVTDIPSGLGLVEHLRPVSFLYNGTNASHYGLVAEDVAKVAPEIVTKDADGKPYAVEYLDLIPILVRTAQEQQAEIVRLQKQMKLLKPSR